MVVAILLYHTADVPGYSLPAPSMVPTPAFGQLSFQPVSSASTLEPPSTADTQSKQLLCSRRYVLV